MPASGTPNSPSFESPPIDEVVCAIRFAPLPGIRLPHYGVLWKLLGDEFPAIKHAPPIVSPAGLAVDEETGGPLPRVWYLSKGEDFLVQLQPDFFGFNWRRRGQSYPRFDAVFPRFQENLAKFVKFIADFGLGQFIPLGYELSYINNVARGEGWNGVDDFHHLYPDIAWRTGKRFLPPPIALNWSATFVMPANQGSLSVSSKLGKRKDDEAEVIVLELSARSSMVEQSLDDMPQWFALSHDWIVNGFCDVTGAGVQQAIWKRQDV